MFFKIENTLIQVDRVTCLRFRDHLIHEAHGDIQHVLFIDFDNESRCIGECDDDISDAYTEAFLNLVSSGNHGYIDAVLLLDELQEEVSNG